MQHPMYHHTQSLAGLALPNYSRYFHVPLPSVSSSRISNAGGAHCTILNVLYASMVISDSHAAYAWTVFVHALTVLAHASTGLCSCFDVARLCFDGPGSCFDSPHSCFDGPRSCFDGPRLRFDGLHSRFHRVHRHFISRVRWARWGVVYMLL